MSKHIPDTVTRSFSITRSDDKPEEFVISTEAIDSHGTVFKMAGAILQPNTPVCYNHRGLFSDDPDDVIATSKVRNEGAELVAYDLEWDDLEANKKASSVKRKLNSGALSKASITAIVHKAHWGVESANENADVLYFDEWELVEWSVVVRPSNTEAQKRSQEFQDLQTRFPKQTENNLELYEARHKHNLNKYKNA